MKQKTRSGLVWLLFLTLFISVCASTIAVVSCIRYYTAIADVDSMIPLVPEGVALEDLQDAAIRRAGGVAKPMGMTWADSPVSVSQLGYTVSAPGIPSPVQIIRLNETLNSTFSVSDDKTVWGTNTQVDIFKSSYTNGAGQIVAASGNGDKIIAPGTENSYIFQLKNVHAIPVDYTVTVKAWFTPDDAAIPVVCRLSRYDGKWIAGDEQTWVDVSAFNGVKDSDFAYEASYVTYTLDWQWPYAGDDDTDIALAQRAAQEDLTLTIEISTVASPLYDPAPDEPIVPPPGGGSGTEPEIPDVPDDPVVPDKPVDPDNPVDPDTPVTPDEPVIPDEPDKPGVGEDLPPQTGDNSHMGLWTCVSVLSFILMMILIFWKEKEENTEDTEAAGYE